MLHMFTGDGHKIEKQNTCKCREKKVKKRFCNKSGQRF